MTLDKTNVIQIKTVDCNQNNIMFEFKIDQEDRKSIFINKFMDEGIHDIDSIRLDPEQLDLMINTLVYIKNNLMAITPWEEGLTSYEV